jgi:hypothetical protein
MVDAAVFLPSKMSEGKPKTARKLQLRKWGQLTGYVDVKTSTRAIYHLNNLKKMEENQMS